MRSSFIFGLICLSFFKYAESLPQNPLIETPRPFQPIHARAILKSPTGAPIFGVIDFRAKSLSEVKVELIVHGLDRVVPHMGHPYHIHAKPVGADGDCQAAGDHLNPTGIPESIPCNPLMPRSCEEGDLSGKHGLLKGNLHDIHVTYTDDTLQFFSPESGILGRGVVVHGANGFRIACGNIHRVN